MMKTARNLDIAVVVSGDGDFASAIRAVQEMGVRVEVISFRGNTSSDLIDVADMFTDIAQVARVEKGSARSGRRVAAEGDLSMTEVPEKETEGAPRRRRSRAAEERQRVPVAAAAVESVAHAASVVALPGERLSRAAEGEIAEVDGAEPIDSVDAGDGGDDVFGEEGRRRRRRRGGRGRGRGRRTDEAGQPLEAGVVGAAAAADDDEEFDEPQPANLPNHTFGSVWDSQIGVRSSASPAVDSLSGGEAFDEDDLEEPEVPEYLLAERRQRGGRPAGNRTGGGRPARGRSAYQAALDRERFGSAGSPRPAFGSTSSGTRSPQGNRDRGRGGRPQQSSGRPPMRAPRMDDRPRYEDTARSTSAEPWSEVPPELEQLLRAEMSRKAPVASMSEPQMAPTTPSEPVAEAKPVRRTRTTKAAATDISAEAVEAAADAAPAKAARSRTTKPAATKSTTTRTRKAATTDADGEAAPKKPATRTRKAAAPAEPAAPPPVEEL
jgi:ribonuclease E